MPVIGAGRKVTGLVFYTVVDTENLSREDRFDQWCETTAREMLPGRMRVLDPMDFHGSIRAATLGPVHLTDLAFTPLAFHRDSAHVRRHDPQDLSVYLIERGTTAMEVRRHQEVACAGDLLIYGTWHPYQGLTTASEGRIRSLMLNIPRRLLPLPPRLTDRLLGCRVAAIGTAAVLAGLMKNARRAVDQDGDLAPAEAAHLGEAAVSLVASVIAGCTRQQLLPVETRQQVMLERIHAFIDMHLADPALSPQAVADAHYMSVRQLHRLFQADGATVGAWIRSRRLDRCRKDLGDPRLRHRPIHAIAARWGFTSPADFSRAFRTAYGMPPSQARGAAFGGMEGGVG